MWAAASRHEAGVRYSRVRLERVMELVSVSSVLLSSFRQLHNNPRASSFHLYEFLLVTVMEHYPSLFINPIKIYTPALFPSWTAAHGQTY
jgi:hypothetical protein